MKKIEKTDWFDEGMKVLEAEGFQRITIDNLCKSLKVTKGSFYHHFKNTEGYIDALMQYWQNKNTLEFIKNTEKVIDITERFITLNDFAGSSSHKAEQVIRGWSFSNKIVKQYVKQVDNIRMKYLIDLHIQKGMKAKIAQNYAILQYGTLIGIQQLLPDISKDDFHDLYKIRLNDNMDN
ncbi:TetR family regulatory protein [Elizabethkingia miricola]|nr:TetR family regulatory protein [Elizabethkingia miricola]